ncbi:MAG: hypothetical protein ACK4E3_10455 [Brevundimonas sp.]|uniref:hypothetical protein n=1 Tax=Brevundimonas sp. TaxID=1871086 RepID=UPI00391D11B6
MPARRAAAQPAASPAPQTPRCADNDCQREQAAAMTAIAAELANIRTGLEAIKPYLETAGEVAGKWLRFCAFLRTWFPRVGWWLLPIMFGLLTSGGGELGAAMARFLTHVLTGAVESGVPPTLPGAG